MASNLIRNIIITVLVAVLAAGFVIAARFFTGTVVPPVDAYLDGQRVLFIHTETSDPGVAALLTSMMGSPVVVVPTLAKVPKALLAPVYVFKNGVAGEGPFKFQPDVFAHAPGAKGYSPLRELNLVSWKDAANARELKHADEVTKAVASGEITIEKPGVVVNMPLLTWPGGQR